MADHSSTLVSASDVIGATVYGPDESKIGSIDRVMIDKTTGKVAYAIMSFGAILVGIGGQERPVPWGALRYDPSLGGFRTDITQQQLANAPETKERWQNDRDWEERTHLTFGLSPYWI